MSFRRCLSHLSSHVKRNQPQVKATFKPWTRKKSQLAPQWSLKIYRDRNELLLNEINQSQESFVSAVDHSKADDVAYEYSNYRRFLKMLKLPAHSPYSQLGSHTTEFKPLRTSVILKAAKILAATGKKADVDTLSELLDDCQALHGVPVDNDLLKVALEAMTSCGEAIPAHDLLFRHRSKHLGLRKLSSGIWVVVMKGLAKAGETKRLMDCIRRVRLLDTQQCYSLLEVVLQFPTESAVEITDTILFKKRLLGSTFNEDIYRLLKDSVAKHGGIMEEIARKFKVTSQPTCSPNNEAGHVALKAAWMKGRNEFITTIQRLCDAGFRADERTLSRLLDNVMTIDDLKFLEEELKVQANTVSWSKLIKNVLEKQGKSEALRIYKASKEKGIKPDSAMVHPLLRTLCRSTIKEPDAATLDTALSIYRDLQKPSTAAATSATAKESTADTAIFNTLLRALASTTMTSKYFPIALSLLRDMKSQNIHMDPMTATSITILLMRSSRSYSEALKAYRYMQSSQPDIFDAKAYTAILSAFCSAKFEEGSYPPASGYFEIVRDMERRGIHRSAQVYTVLLGRYAAVADRIRVIKDGNECRELQQAIVTVLRKTQDHLTVDASVTPDAPLYNQFMDAYNRVGSFENVLKVWTLLSSTGRQTNASVSIIMDACGFAGQYTTASDICASLLKSGFVMNLRNWNSWVECLCRLGQLSKALDVVCLEMPNSPDTFPDQDTMRVIASFGRSMGRVDEIRCRIQARFPEHWSTFSQVLHP